RRMKTGCSISETRTGGNECGQADCGQAALASVGLASGTTRFGATVPIADGSVKELVGRRKRLPTQNVNLTAASAFRELRRTSTRPRAGRDRILLRQWRAPTRRASS